MSEIRKSIGQIVERICYRKIWAKCEVTYFHQHVAWISMINIVYMYVNTESERRQKITHADFNTLGSKIQKKYNEMNLGGQDLTSGISN